MFGIWCILIQHVFIYNFTSKKKKDTIKTFQKLSLLDLKVDFLIFKQKEQNHHRVHEYNCIIHTLAQWIYL